MPPPFPRAFVFEKASAAWEPQTALSPPDTRLTSTGNPQSDCYLTQSGLVARGP